LDISRDKIFGARMLVVAGVSSDKVRGALAVGVVERSCPALLSLLVREFEEVGHHGSGR
jgi:hypothetical protein